MIALLPKPSIVESNGKVGSQMSGTSAEQTEHDLRVDLAASYRLMALYGWDELVFTHISMRIRDQITTSSSIPTACSLKSPHPAVKIDLDGNKLQDSPWPVNPAGLSSIRQSTRPARMRSIVLHSHHRRGCRSLGSGWRPAANLAAGIHRYGFAGVPRLRRHRVAR